VELSHGFYTLSTALMQKQGRPKAYPATLNALQESLGDKKEVRVDKKFTLYLFVSSENKHIKTDYNLQKFLGGQK